MLNGPSVHQSQLDMLLTVPDVGLGKALAGGSSPGLSILFSLYDYLCLLGDYLDERPLSFFI